MPSLPGPARCRTSPRRRRRSRASSRCPSRRRSSTTRSTSRRSCSTRSATSRTTPSPPPRRSSRSRPRRTSRRLPERPPVTNPWQDQLEALGEYIRTQRQLANLSLRELAAMTDVSNAYLSQIERGLHEPSVRVLRSIAQALELSANTVLAQAGLLEDEPGEPPTEAAIRTD